MAHSESTEVLEVSPLRKVREGSSLKRAQKNKAKKNISSEGTGFVARRRCFLDLTTDVEM